MCTLWGRCHRATYFSHCRRCVFSFQHSLIDDDLSGSTLAAILAANNGKGATLYTDHVQVDSSNNTIIVRTANNSALGEGCWTAL